MGWGGERLGSVSLPPLRMVTGPVQHFRSAIFDAWRFSLFSRLSEKKVFVGWGVYFQGSLQPFYLVPPTGTR